MNRDLFSNEVVHHINGRKTDNQIENLCLMDKEKHEHFHAWLMWKNKKSGKYPTIRDQKRILESDYDGTLLENVKVVKSASEASTGKTEIQEIRKSRESLIETLQVKIQSEKLDQENKNENLRIVRQKSLFNVLRNLRKQIAEKKNIPVYMVFDNRTLAEMSDEMPDSESTMLEIWGVGPLKMQMYGAQFLTAIKKFKEEADQN